MCASASVFVKAIVTARARSASSITACRTSAALVPEATAIASSINDCFTPIRMSFNISFSRYFASIAVARCSKPISVADRAAVDRAVAIASNATESSSSVSGGMRGCVRIEHVISRSTKISMPPVCRRQRSVGAVRNLLQCPRQQRPTRIQLARVSLGKRESRQIQTKQPCILQRMFRDNAPANHRDRPNSFGNRGAFFQSAGLGGQLIGQSCQECKLRHAGYPRHNSHPQGCIRRTPGRF